MQSRPFSFLIAALAAAFCLVALPLRAQLRVVTTTTDLAAIAAAVGGGRAKVTALALPTQDPHWVDAKPNLALELSHADLLLLVGAELEVGWLPTLLVGSRNGKVQPGAPGYLDCSTLVRLLEVPTHAVDRSHGDVHASGNPHYMLDPRAAERVAVGIGKRLAELDPAGREHYLQSTRAFVEALRTARASWEQRLAKARGNKVITFHRSMSYLADWVGLEVIDTVEPKPGIPPNPSHVGSLIDRAKRLGVKLVLQESFQPNNTSELVARKIGARFVEVKAAPNHAAGQSYVAFMAEVVAALAEAL